MAEESKQHFFSHIALVEEMVKRLGLHEGHWMLTVELGLKGTNVNVQSKEGPSLVPAGLVIISRIGITQTDEANDLSVDAADVNPLRLSPRRKTKRITKKAR